MTTQNLDITQPGWYILSPSTDNATWGNFREEINVSDDQIYNKIYYLNAPVADDVELTAANWTVINKPDSNDSTVIFNKNIGYFILIKRWVRYVRFERIDNTLPTWDLELNVREMYVYNTDGTNIGAAGTPSCLNPSTNSLYDISYLNNGHIGGNDSGFALSSGGHNRGPESNTTKNWVQIELNEDVPLSNIQSVLVYNRTGNEGITSRPAGCVIQLKDANENIIVQSDKLTSTTTSLVAYYQDGATPVGDYVSLGTFDPNNVT